MRYVCGDLNKYEDETLLSLEWKTEPPTEEGYYWLNPKNGADKLIGKIVRPSNGDTLLFVDGRLLEDFSYFSMWLGPLPEPEPPNA